MPAEVVAARVLDDCVVVTVAPAAGGSTVVGVERIGHPVPIAVAERRTSTRCSRANGSRANGCGGTAQAIAVLVGLDVGVDAVRLAHALLVIPAGCTCMLGALLGLDPELLGLGGLFVGLGLGAARGSFGLGGRSLAGPHLTLLLDGVLSNGLRFLSMGLGPRLAHGLGHEPDDGQQDECSEHPPDPRVAVHVSSCRRDQCFDARCVRGAMGDWSRLTWEATYAVSAAPGILRLASVPMKGDCKDSALGDGIGAQP